MNKYCLSTLLISIITFLSATGLHAQNHIILINGKIIEASSYIVNSEYVTYRKPGSTSRKPKVLDRFDVFEIIKADSSEEMIYNSDSIDFSVAEVREYIKGEQAAHLYYKRPSNIIGAALVGAGSGFMYFYGLPVPMIYSIIVGRFNTHKIRVPDTFDQHLATSEPFITGYQKTSRNMKIQQSLKWGYISLGVSLAGLIIYGYSVH